MVKISIHTPAKGVTTRNFYTVLHMPHFNPHSREGSDVDNIKLLNNNPIISIHTPAKGVTTLALSCSLPAFISIHTPAKGVTLPCLLRCFANTDFNPHSREGSDLDYKKKRRIVNISIHTPAKGVTSNFTSSLLWDKFQSTLPRRE